jgi:transposase-like protein
LREGATENAAVAKALLQELVCRGLDPARPRLFVIDGSKALRSAIDAVFGADQLVQRCRNQKQTNVVSHLPKDQHSQALATLREAVELEAAEGMAKLEQYASRLEREWPGAAASLREGLRELFAVNRLGLTSALRRCLGTANLIDNGHLAARDRMRRVRHWQSGEMALRWASASFEAASKGFCRIIAYKDLWMLEALLDERDRDKQLARQTAAG